MQGIATLRTKRGYGPGSVVSNALSLFGSTLITSGFGFVFWVVAAHSFSRTAMGAGSAAISAMQLLAIAGMLGLGTLLIGELSRGAGSSRHLIGTALAASSAVGFVISVGVGVTIQAVATPSEISDGWVGVILFAVTAGISAGLLVLDDAMLGLARASWQLWRNLAFAMLKLAALPIVAIGIGLDSSTGLMVSWLLGAVLSLFVPLVLASRAHVSLLGRPRWSLLGSYGRTALTHHWLNLSSGAPRLVLPVLVAAFLSPAVNASFYTAILLVGFAYVVPTHLATALFAIASGDREALGIELRRSIRISAIVGLVSAAVFGLGGRFLLGIFGTGYSSASGVLAILGTATFASGVRSHYIAVCRVNGDLSRCAVLSCIGSGLEVGLPCAALAFHHGLDEVALAWVIAMVIEAVVFWPVIASAAMLPGRASPRLAGLVRWTAPRTIGHDEGSR